MTSSTDDWPTHFFDLEPRLVRLARRRFPSDLITAEIAHGRVLDKLSADDWAQLRRFQGGSAPATYLTSVYRNALEDVARSILGRCRPPKHIQQLGDLWVAAFELLCCQRRMDGELAGLLATDFCPANLDNIAWDTEMRDIARRIRGRVPDCGRRQATTSLDNPDVEIADDPDGDPDEQLESQEADLLTLALRDLFTSNPTSGSDSRLDAIRSALHSLDLKAEAVLLARLVHLEQIRLPEAAKMLGLNERTARRRLDELFEQLRSALEPYV